MFDVFQIFDLVLCLSALQVNEAGHTNTSEPVPVIATYGGLGLPVLVLEHNGSPRISVVKPDEMVCVQDVGSNAVMCADDVSEEGLIMGVGEDLVVQKSGPANYMVCRHRHRSSTPLDTPRLAACKYIALDPSSSIQQCLASLTALMWNQPWSADLHSNQAGSRSNHEHKRRFLLTEVGTGAVNATIEILIWTDFSFYKSFNVSSAAGTDVEREIRRYVATTVSAANLRFQKALADEPSFNVTLVLSGMVICKTPNCSEFIGNYSVNNTVNNYVALYHFTETLRRNYAAHSLQFRYDFAALFTRLDITDAQGFPIGVANADDICKVREGESSAVIEDQGAYSSVGTLVHELSHTLGADHDGWFRAANCTSADGYIMSTLAPLSKRGFHFSPCSITSMKENLLKPTSACVYDLPHQLYMDTELTCVLPGQIYNTTAQCRQLYGTPFCLSVGTSLDGICYKMYCWDPVLANVCSTKTPAALGTSCGPGKWCVGGDCVSDSRAP